jgi:hypothetical protein
MAALSALYPYVVPHFPNVPELAVDRAILDGAIQFCRDSLVWQENTDPIYVIAGVAEYDVEPVSNAEPIRVLAAVKADEHLDRALLAGSDIAKIGEVTGFVQPIPRIVRLVSTPEEGASIVLRVALEPKDTAPTLDDGLVRYWREPIAAAARQRLALTYGDINQAQIAEQQYQFGLGRARAQAQVGVHRWRLRTRAVP